MSAASRSEAHGAAGEEGVAAQVSLYPLRQEVLAPAIDEALDILRASGLAVQPGSMSTVVTGARAPLFRALEAVFAAAIARGPAVMSITVSNACPVPHSE